MAVIYCPQCDSEIPEKTAVCPSCGFNLDTYEEDENSFNALLSEANKKLGEDNSSVISGMAISDKIDDLLDGNIVDLTPEEAEDAPPPAAPVAPPSVPKAETAPQSEPETKAAQSEEPQKKEKPKKEKKVKEKNVKEKKVKEPKIKLPKPEREKGSVSFLITVVTAVVAAALGFFVSLFVFGDVFQTEEEKFAIMAANSVNSTLNVNEQLFVYKAYVNFGAASNECVLYAVKDYKEKISATKYRVVVNKDNSAVINIYYQIDETSEEYLAMKNSDDPEVRIQASILKNYSDSIEAAHREIMIESPNWIKIDISEINSNINSQQSRTAVTAAAALENDVSESGSGEDIEDLEE